MMKKTRRRKVPGQRNDGIGTTDDDDNAPSSSSSHSA